MCECHLADFHVARHLLFVAKLRASYVGKLVRIAEIGHRSQCVPNYFCILMHPLHSSHISLQLGSARQVWPPTATFQRLWSSHSCFSDEVRLFFEQLRAELTSTWSGQQLFYLSDAKYNLEEKKLDGRDASRIGVNINILDNDILTGATCRIVAFKTEKSLAGFCKKMVKYHKGF